MPYSTVCRALFGLAILTMALLSACATLPNRDPPTISVAGVEPLRGEGMELRFAIKLRVQNPNNTDLHYRGVALQLDVNGQRLATGVSNQGGTVKRFGESVFTVPVTVSMADVGRQIGSLLDGKSRDGLNYVVSGKLDGGVFGTVRFSDRGTMGADRGARK
jgi:LEA14-like dessication related protein